MAAGHATAAFRRPSAMQLNPIGIAEDANKKTGRHLLVDLSATECSVWSAPQDGHTGAILLLPIMVAAAARVSAQSAALR
jgi:hypothetical protein